MTEQPGATHREITREHLAALGIFRIARNAFFALAVFAVALHLGSWFLVQMGDDTSSIRAAAPWQDQPIQHDGPAKNRSGDSGRWSHRMDSALKVAGYVGRASALVIAGVYIVSLLVSLSGKLGGAAALAKACVWSLAALALVTPWVSAGAESSASSNSAFYGVDELMDSSVSIVRYVLCPLLVVVFLALAQFEFRSAYRKINMLPSAKLPIHEV